MNLTENEARPVGHLTFVSKRQSAVQMWRDHLQQNALNRARGVEKAKATRQRKKHAKEKKMALCLYKRTNFADVLECLQRDLASRLRPTPNGKRQAAACRKSKKIILF